MNNAKYVHPYHASILMLAPITAVAHLYLGMQTEEQLHNFFLLNGFGYVGLTIIFLLPQLKSFHRLIGWVFFGYTVLTIAVWCYLATPWSNQIDPFDASIKAVEIILAIHLVLDWRQEKSIVG